MKGFGSRLHSARIAKNMSQEELAGVAGYHRQTISEMERGVSCPALFTVFVLADVLDIAPKTLLFGEE